MRGGFEMVLELLFEYGETISSLFAQVPTVIHFGISVLTTEGRFVTFFEQDC